MSFGSRVRRLTRTALFVSEKRGTSTQRTRCPSAPVKMRYVVNKYTYYNVRGSNVESSNTVHCEQSTYCINLKVRVHRQKNCSVAHAFDAREGEALLIAHEIDVRTMALEDEGVLVDERVRGQRVGRSGRQMRTLERQLGHSQVLLRRLAEAGAGAHHVLHVLAGCAQKPAHRERSTD